ncbi:hypothetical protein [Streptomyces sp. NPDC051109]
MHDDYPDTDTDTDTDVPGALVPAGPGYRAADLTFDDGKALPAPAPGT